MNVTFTPAADKFIRRMVRFGGTPGCGFRLSVHPGGCSGLAADFSVEPAPKEGDAVLDYNGVRIFLPAESRILLEGVTVDFADSVTETGFVFRDPKGSAGCCTPAPPKELIGLSTFSKN